MLIDDNSASPFIVVDEIYKLFLVDNVKSYDIVDYSKLNISIQHNEIGEKSYYFVIDTMIHEAFGHWVFESAIYLPIFKTLKTQYKNFKIYLRGKKQFKTLFLNFFQIDEADISYELKPNNLCLFPSPISCLNHNSLSDSYRTIFSRFVKMFHDYETESNVNYAYVFLPRQTKENYKTNDRIYDLDFIFKFLESKNSYILNTDSIVDLKDQITLIRSAPKVIITSGSPFLVNNMFCKNQTINIVIEDITCWQAHNFAKIKLIIEFISTLNNNVIKYIKRDPSLI